MTAENKETKQAIEWFFSQIGYFTHYEFFTKELWRKVKGFKNADKGEITAAFLSSWLYYSERDKINENPCGPRCIPCGSTWGTVLDWDDETMENYYKQYEPVFEAFRKWQYKQR